MAAKTKGVVHNRIDLHLARRIGHVIQVALRIGHLIIDRRRHSVGLDRFGAGNHLRRAGRAQHVTGRALG